MAPYRQPADLIPTLVREEVKAIFMADILKHGSTKWKEIRHVMFMRYGQPFTLRHKKEFQNLLHYTRRVARETKKASSKRTDPPLSQTEQLGDFAEHFQGMEEAAAWAYGQLFTYECLHPSLMDLCPDNKASDSSSQIQDECVSNFDLPDPPIPVNSQQQDTPPEDTSYIQYVLDSLTANDF